MTATADFITVRLLYYVQILFNYVYDKHTDFLPCVRVEGLPKAVAGSNVLDRRKVTTGKCILRQGNNFSYKSQDMLKPNSPLVRLKKVL